MLLTLRRPGRREEERMEEGHSGAVTRGIGQGHVLQGPLFSKWGPSAGGGPVTCERRFMKQCDFAFPVGVPYTWLKKKMERKDS